MLASGGWEGDILLWSVDSGKPLFRLKGHQSGINRLVFSLDGKTLVSDSVGDGTTRWWSVATGKEMLLLKDVSMISDGASDLPPAEWDMGGRRLVWREGKARVHVTALPSLAEIDAAEKVGSAGRTR
jgi:WD40 repeat protein